MISWEHPEFRREFSHLEEVKSLISGLVNVMALTATATRTLRFDVCKILGVGDPHVVTVSPHKSNILLSVSTFESLEVTFMPIMEKLRTEQIRMGRTIIFCQQQETCARLYSFFRLFLKTNFTNPRGYPDLPQLKLVDMYTSGMHPAVTSQSCPPLLRVTLCFKS